MSVTLLRPYTTLDRVQTAAKSISPDLNDVFLTAINDASRYIEEVCHRKFWKQDHRSSPLLVRKEWVVGQDIFLPWPIVTLSQVMVSDTVLQSTDYAFSNADDGSAGAVLHRIGAGWTGNLGGDTVDCDHVVQRVEDAGMYKQVGYPAAELGATDIRLTGLFGYTLASAIPEGETEPVDNTQLPPVDLPGSVGRACTLIAAAWSGESRREMVGISGEKTTYLEYEIPKEAAKLLRRYAAIVM